MPAVRSPVSSTNSSRTLIPSTSPARSSALRPQADPSLEWPWRWMRTTASSPHCPWSRCSDDLTRIAGDGGSLDTGHLEYQREEKSARSSWSLKRPDILWRRDTRTEASHRVGTVGQRPAFPSSPWQKSSRHSTVPASRRTALRFGHILTVCSLIAPCPAGAGTVSVLAGLSPRTASRDRRLLDLAVDTVVGALFRVGLMEVLCRSESVNGTSRVDSQMAVREIHKSAFPDLIFSQ